MVAWDDSLVSGDMEAWDDRADLAGWDDRDDWTSNSDRSRYSATSADGDGLGEARWNGFVVDRGSSGTDSRDSVCGARQSGRADSQEGTLKDGGINAASSLSLITDLNCALALYHEPYQKDLLGSRWR